MKESNTNEKIQNFFGKLGKLSKATWAIIAVVVVVIIGFFVYSGNRKSEVLTDKDVKVKFDGYNGEGRATCNEEVIQLKILKILAQKVGLDKDTEDLMLKSFDNHGLDFNRISLDSSKIEKLKKIEDLIDDVHIDFDKRINLKNGEKIHLKITVNNGKDNPIKPESKTYTVKGLENIKQESTSSVLSSVKVSFAGFNGIGRVIIKSDKIKDGTFKVKNNGKLSNGDTVKIKAPDELFNKQGVHYTGDKYVKATVDGLQDLSKIKNIDAIKKFSDDVIKNSYKSDGYEITFINLYAFAGDSNDSDSSSSSDSAVKSDVTINDDSASKVSGKRMSVIGLYQIVDKDLDNSDPFLRKVTINNLKDEDNVANISSISADDDTSVVNASNTLSIEQHDLMAKGIKLK
ncbi:hypothetical protein [Xylocopilactobacillus apis]|uniref:Membrane-associated protein n=1 Tax=Xylocopilactobacillus apis TaxID=2932183 RepID=A0AAU9D2Q9_9LACO|nr:hypothetical protein [Xylocopilactobacillus apis]BDR56585.1 hypothetical protein KIMC2_11470 [Xylocopilactobacillus apis]